MHPRHLLVVMLLAACSAPDDDEAASAGSALGVSTHRPPHDRGQPQADLDGDGALDLFWLMVRDELRLTWHVDLSTNGFGAFDVRVVLPGTRGDQPVPADYDHDGRVDLAIRNRDGMWLIDLYEAAEESGMNGGFDGEFDAVLVERHADADPARADPVLGDYDGDGAMDLAVVGSDAVWRIDYRDLGLLGSQPETLGFGGWDVELVGHGDPSAYPLPADYDGDGTTDIAARLDTGAWRIDYAPVFGTWDDLLVGFGAGDPEAVAAVADFDLDGRADLSVREPDGRWHIDLAADGYDGFDLTSTGSSGLEDAQPLVGDYDGDGLADLAVKTDCGPWTISFNEGLGPDKRPIFDRLTQTVTWPTDVREVVVTTADDLVEVLDQDFLAGIRIATDAVIDMADRRDVLVRDCRRISSDRKGLRPGGLIHTTDGTFGAIFKVVGDGVRFDHLRLRGPSGGSGEEPHVTAIRVDSARGFRFDHNEIFHFPRSAVSVADELERIRRGSGIARIEDSFFHHNQRAAFGYGVVVGSGAWAQVERNVFNWHRHAFSHDGSVESGYLAYRNYLLEGTTGYYAGEYWGQHFDIHGTGEDGHYGTAGEYFDIGWNTVRGEQAGTFNLGNRPVLRVRGTPTDHVDFHDNVTAQSEEHAVTTCWAVGWSCADADIRTWANQFDHDQSMQLGVAELDGDGRSDVFLATGVTFWYSSGGIAEWRYLQTAPGRARELRFGELDDVRYDNRLVDDVLRLGEDGALYYSSGGRGPWTFLATPVGPYSDLHVADFNGDGRDDLFNRSADGRWHVRDGLTGTWSVNPAPTTVPFSELRFGQFDSIPGIDVIYRALGTLRISSSGTQPWVTLDFDDPGSLDGAIVADFDGDGRDDLARRAFEGWLWRPRGVGGWLQLRDPTPAPSYADLKDALIGEFDENPGFDVVRIERYLDQSPSGAVVERDGTRFVKWTIGGTFEPWSEQEIR
jgi:hypothetical protein